MSSEIESRLYRKVREAGGEQGWWCAPSLLAAVSGGGDSMAMLHLLHRLYEGKLVVAHLEHGLRKERSLDDARFVEANCRALGVPCFVRHGDVPGNRRQGESLEMAGRRIRYDFFLELMRKEQIPFVATGHTSDDVVETLLLNLFRGTGIKGLVGIPSCAGGVVRPLLCCKRDELRAFLLESGVPWRDDETNEKNVYRRNKVRNQLLPWVRTNLNDSAERVLLGLSMECAKESRRREKDASHLLPYVSRSHPFALAAWDFDIVRRLREATLADLLREQGRRLDLPSLDRRRLIDLCGFLRTRGRWRFQWAKDVEVCGGPLIGWIKRASLVPLAEFPLGRLAPGCERLIPYGDWRVAISVRERSSGLPREGAWRAVLPYDPDGVLSLANSLGSSALPWWSRAAWPSVVWRGAKSSGCWTPGRFYRVQETGTYAIIARVFNRG